jgi:hypothetical protein
VNEPKRTPPVGFRVRVSNSLQPFGARAVAVRQAPHDELVVPVALVRMTGALAWLGSDMTAGDIQRHVPTSLVRSDVRALPGVSSRASRSSLSPQSINRATGASVAVSSSPNVVNITLAGLRSRWITPQLRRRTRPPPLVRS